MWMVKNILIYYQVSSQNVGHAPKPVTEAIKKQAEKFIHYTPAYMYHEPAVKLSKSFVKLLQVTMKTCNVWIKWV